MVTGLNRAFIVGNETKEALIREDPRSAELLKPLVRGRDVHAYRVEWAGLWLIATHNGYGTTPAVDVTTYPAVRRHLDAFLPALGRRQDKGDTPYNLRSCAYYGEFERPKLIWIELAGRGRFALDRERLFVEATAFMATSTRTGDLTWLCAVLNSALASWWVRTTAPTSGAGATRWKKVYVENLPLPTASPETGARVSALVERAVQTYDAERRALLQEALDREVAMAYGLGHSEFTLVRSGL